METNFSKENNQKAIHVCQQWLVASFNLEALEDLWSTQIWYGTLSFEHPHIFCQSPSSTIHTQLGHNFLNCCKCIFRYCHHPLWLIAIASLYYMVSVYTSWGKPANELNILQGCWLCTPVASLSLDLILSYLNTAIWTLWNHIYLIQIILK